MFTLRGIHDDAVLELASTQPDVYTATLRASDVSATVQVFHFGGDYIGEFFRSLARDWRGWEGPREWRSLERVLGFDASINRAGLVQLRVTLRDTGMYTWLVQYDLAIENGALDTLALDAEAFGRSIGATA